MRCYYEKGKIDVSSWFMKEGDMIVSVESFYQQKTSYEWIHALEDCSLQYISYSQLVDMYRRFPEFNFISRELLQHYYILWTQLLYAIRMKTATEKYAWLLERFPDYVLRVPAKYLASWLGVSAEMRQCDHKCCCISHKWPSSNRYQSADLAAHCVA